MVLRTQYRPAEVQTSDGEYSLVGDESLLFAGRGQSLLETVDGPRWFIWRESEIPSKEAISIGSARLPMLNKGCKSSSKAIDPNMIYNLFIFFSFQ